MLTELVLSLFVGLVESLAGLLPSDAPPTWVTDANGYLSQLYAAGAGLGAWIPWTLVATVTATVLICMALGFAIKLVRIVASYLTLGGGSAG